MFAGAPLAAVPFCVAFPYARQEWVVINEGQTPGWTPLNETETPGWTRVVETQVPEWTQIAEPVTYTG